MTPRRRLNALLSGETPDRVPIIGNLFEQGARLEGVSIRDYYGDGARVARAQLAMQARYGYDNLWGFFYVGFAAELFGVHNVIYHDDGPPIIGRLLFQPVPDFALFKAPDDLTGHPRFRELARCISILKHESHGSIPVFSAIPGSFTLPSLLMGTEKWLEMLLMGPAEIRDRLLAECSEFSVRYINALRGAGADVICYANPLASPDIIPPEIFKNIVLPQIKKEMNRVGAGGIVSFNFGFRNCGVLGEMMKETGISVFYLSPGDSIAEADAETGGEAVLIAPVNDIRLYHMTDREIDAEVSRIREEGRNVRRFAIGNMTMPLSIPEGKIRRFFNAALRPTASGPDDSQRPSSGKRL